MFGIAGTRPSPPPPPPLPIHPPPHPLTALEMVMCFNPSPFSFFVFHWQEAAFSAHSSSFPEMPLRPPLPLHILLTGIYAQSHTIPQTTLQ
jgi:hypothetical protein